MVPWTTRVSWALAPVLIACAVVAEAAPASTDPPSDGLVLWLDASDSSAFDLDDQGRIACWRSRIGSTRAEQPDTLRRPLYIAQSEIGTPTVRFHGDAFLNLGRPAALQVAAKESFTLAVAYDVGLGDCGTFLALGGGAEQDRAYQFYVAPGRLGAIAHGSTRQERPRVADSHWAVLLCDGRQCRVMDGGREVMSFPAGVGSSQAEVLLGARRASADNRGFAYPLRGDVAEVIVYDRVLTEEEFSILSDYLGKRHAPDSVEALVETDPVAAAERLWSLSQTGRLDDEQAELAAKLLEHEDWFVRGAADWALATRVGADNNGEDLIWTGVEPTGWFQKYRAQDFAFRIRADYVRQAMTLGIHRSPSRLLESASDAVARGEAILEKSENGRGAPAGVDLAGQLGQAKQLRNRLQTAVESGGPDTLTDCRRLWLELRLALRPVVLSEPSVDFDRIVFTTRYAAHTVRNITRSFAWKHKPGGDICVLSGLLDQGRVQAVLGGRLGPGYVWGLDLWWDGDRVVFSYARQPSWPPALSTVAGDTSYALRKLEEPLHIFEASVDGGQLTQLTDDAYWNDFEPTYCADGRIVFSSDRCARAAECGSFDNDIPNPNLYIMDGDGGSLRLLTDNKDLDRYPHTLDNGLIAYTHWEYQERHFMEVHSIWTVHPDGTMADALFKHHMPAPCALRNTRSVPESTKLVAIATGHHTFANGPVVLVDPRWGMNSSRGLEIVTPGVLPLEDAMAGSPVAEGGVPDAGGLYRTPWALSAGCFLVGYAYPRVGSNARGTAVRADSNGFGIYLIDVYGNKELLFRDPLLSASFPMPLRPRRRPPVVSDVVGAAGQTPAGTADCYVADVYEGLEGIPRGTVKYLRISQHVGWPWDAERGKMPYLPDNAYSRQFGYWSWSPVRVIGTVPVEADGSAYFQVPADTALYFQLLDERWMEIRRMRSMASFKDGETRGCRGCHESAAKTPRVAEPLPAALRREPLTPEVPAWGNDRLLGYEWLVQPVLDRHCVRCHGEEEEQGGLDLSGRRADDGFLVSFHTIFGNRIGQDEPAEALVSVADRFGDSSVTGLKEFGSHQSRLIRVLLDDELHRREVRMDQQQWEALVTWVDANAPYHDHFFNKRPADGVPIRNIVPPISASFRFARDYQE